MDDEGSVESPRVLSIDLRSPAGQKVAEMAQRSKGFDRLHLTIAGPLDELKVKELMDRLSTLPEGQRPRISLRICGAVPDTFSFPAEVTVVELPFAMEGENLAEGEDQTLASFARLLQERGVELVLDLAVHQRNWIHLRSWLMRARRLSATVSLRLVPASETGSLGELDGDALACVHGIFRYWLNEYPLHADRSQAGRLAEVVLGQVRRWQRQGADRSPSRSHLRLPDDDHSLLQDDASLEPFLGELLRIYDDPHIEQLLANLVEGKSFVEEARGRRSFRLVALWLACVFNRPEALQPLRRILHAPEDATRILVQDREALAGTLWHGWLNGWTEQLRLRSLGHRDQRFEIGDPQRAAVPESARVTVIIPSYNHEAFIADAIRSVLGQTRTDFQILVVDDASQDRTVEEASRFDDHRIRILSNAKNLGLGPSLARALDSVDTEFVAVLNSDDLFHRQRLEGCLAQLQEGPQCELVATSLVPIDGDRRICSVADSSPVFDGEAIHNWLRWYEESGRAQGQPSDLLGTLLERNFLITSSNLVARTAFLRRHRDTWQHLEFCLDWQILLTAASEKTLRYVPDALLGYRLHERNTVWFDSNRRWRYYLELSQIVACFLEGLLQPGTTSSTDKFSSALRAIVEHLTLNSNVDWPGVVLGLSLERLHLHPQQLDALAVAGPLQSLDTARHRRLDNEFHLRDLGGNVKELYRMRGERPYLHSVRNRYEALQGDHERLRAETTELQERLTRCATERDEALHSFEHRLGDLLLNGLRFRAPLLAASRVWGGLRKVGAHAPRMLTQSGSRPGRRKPVAVVAATGRFPIYSHTFVYQELMGLGEMGLDVKLFYWIQEDPGRLHDAYTELARNSVKLKSIREDHQRDMEYCKRVFPGRLEALLNRIAQCTGRATADLVTEYEIMQACTFARVAERNGASYIHTYFFYEQSLFGMVTAWLLNIPRGVTAYADHMLTDYPFKLVQLHLETADVIVATSHRIKRELVQIGGQQYADKILVKPNGVDGRRFAFQSRRQASSFPLEVISVSRIEPKKGLLTLIDAARKLVNDGCEVRFSVVGTGDPGSPGSLEFADTFSSRLAEAGVQSHVVLHGFMRQDEIIALLSRAHVFVAPYIETTAGDKDGIPTSLLEAMAMGLPSVTTNAGSISEVIDDGVEGLIVPQNDPVRLAEALQRLMDDPALRAEMGRRARARFEREFDCRVTEKRLHDRITQLLDAPRDSESRV